MSQDDDIELLSNAMFYECKKELAEAEENLKKVEALERNSEFYIHSYFQEIINKVDIRRETFKATIDECSDALLESIRNTESKFIKLSKEVNVVNSKIDKSKTELNGYVEKYSKSDFYQDNLDTLKQDVVNLNKTFENILHDYNDSLTDNTTYEFIEGTVIGSLKIENLFGKLVSIGKLKSNILETSRQQCELNKVCRFESNVKWKLEYRATKNGFGSESFHANCDGLTDTLTVVKTTEGNIFGGFARKPWGTSGVNVSDPESFVFKLVDKRQKHPVKIDRNVVDWFDVCECDFDGMQEYNDYYLDENECSCRENYSSTIYCHGSYGPSFYGLCDILISSHSNRNRESSIKVLGGPRNKFQTVEIEVFTKLR